MDRAPRIEPTVCEPQGDGAFDDAQLGAGRPRFPLTQAARGQSVDLVEIRGEGGLIARLTSMGLKLNHAIRVMANNGLGPVIVACGETRLALGRSMCRDLYVADRSGDRRAGASAASVACA